MRRSHYFWSILLLLLMDGLQMVQPSMVEAVPNQQQSITNSTLIYYRADNEDECGDHSISLGDFIKKSLPFEWVDNWGNDPGGDEALKAGAIAIRSWILSADNSEVYTSNNQNFFCVDARPGRINFISGADVNSYLNSIAAVDDTDGIIMTHPNAPILLGLKAINAQFRAETGTWTLAGSQPWLKTIYDPISIGANPSNSPMGMGQEGSRRWAWGKNDQDTAFPQWDFRRILAHYYSDIQFTGISPTPPDNFRTNIAQIQGIPLDGGLTMCQGDADRTGIFLHYQNVGRNDVPVGTPASCDNTPTFIGYHLYEEDGSGLACANCAGLRKSPVCDTTGVIQPGEHNFVTSFRVFVPQSGQIIEGSNYLLRFDLQHNGVWQGRSNDFAWPPQDVRMIVCDPDPGGGPLAVHITSYPPGVVSGDDLVEGQYGFSWEGINGDTSSYTYDIEYRNKDILSLDYSSGFNPLFQNTPATHFAHPVGCTFDRLDWQFRVSAHNDGEDSDWTQVEARTLIYPFPLLTEPDVIELVDVSESEISWPQNIGIVNLGGGTFTWNASSNQSWIQVDSSGQENEPLGVVLNKPGTEGQFTGNITVNIVSWSPDTYCNRTPSGDLITTFNIPVTLIIAELEHIYLPLIVKNN